MTITSISTPSPCFATFACLHVKSTSRDTERDTFTQKTECVYLRSWRKQLQQSRPYGVEANFSSSSSGLTQTHKRTQEVRSAVCFNLRRREAERLAPESGNETFTVSLLFRSFFSLQSLHREERRGEGSERETKWKERSSSRQHTHTNDEMTRARERLRLRFMREMYERYEEI